MTSRQPAPRAALVAVTDEARSALNDKPEVRMTSFPFNVGREARFGPRTKFKLFIERRLGSGPPLNDLYLLDPPIDALQISREHFAIEYAAGHYVLVDRESTNGTIVAGTPIGGDRTERSADLRDGDLIVIGTADSRYVFRFRVDAH